jgi:hypothetical protein
MKQNKLSLGVLIFIVILGLGAAVAYATHRIEINSEVISIGIVTLILALVVSSAVQIADPWDKVVVLRCVTSTPSRDRASFSLFRSSIPFRTGSTPASSPRASRQKKRSPKTRFRSMSTPCCFGKCSTQRRRPWMSRTIKVQSPGLPRPPCAM